MTQEIKAVNCPKCGAPIEFPQDILEVICPFCGNVLTKDNKQQLNAKIDNKVIDIGVANIDQLHELEEKIGLAKKFQIKFAGHKLMMQTLGSDYEKLIHDKQISIKGTNDKTYILHITGYLEVNDKDGNKIRSGQLFRNGYPASDAIVTFYTYAKFDSNKLDNLWGCGNIKLKGGHLEEVNSWNNGDNY